MLKAIAAATKYVFRGRPVVRDELIGKNETFQHLPGLLSIQLNLSPQREQEFLKRKSAIETACQAKRGAAMRAHDGIMSQANAVRDAALEEAEATARRDKRALYIDFNTITDEPATEKIAAAKNPAVLPGVGADKQQSQPQRRRITTVAKTNEAGPSNGEAPPKPEDKPAAPGSMADVLQRQANTEPSRNLV